jgi:hypothetical protein
MSLERRLLALDHKLALLERETRAWQAESAGPTSRFALHASQIGAVCQDLETMRYRIGQDIEQQRAAPTHDALLRQERRILAALQIWDSYRAKWAFRVEPRLAETLNLIDDLAWQAYRPALQRVLASGQLAPEQARLPPLVYPSPRWSPFARPREQGYELDEASGSWSEVDDFDAVLRCMPVPMIGIPWTQAAHLAEAVFVGHEVGHLVEEDLALSEPLRQALLTALSPADAGRVEAWSEAWRSEVFADLWGLLCCGPAYAWMLADLLGDGAAALDAAQPDARGRFGAYPPRALRLHLLGEGLRQLSPGTAGFFADDAVAIDALAAALPHPMPEHEADVVAVVSALLDTPLAAFAAGAGKAAQPLRGLFGFSATMQQQAQADAKRALARQTLAGSDLRVLFAALALAFRQAPDKIRDVQARFEARLSQVRTQGVRSGVQLPTVVEPMPATGPWPRRCSTGSIGRPGADHFDM